MGHAQGLERLFELPLLIELLGFFIKFAALGGPAGFIFLRAPEGLHIGVCKA